eukprot:3165793-Karenia_brevis.AAC.1
MAEVAGTIYALVYTIVDRIYLYCDVNMHIDNQTPVVMMQVIVHIMHDDLPALTARALHFHCLLYTSDAADDM